MQDDQSARDLMRRDVHCVSPETPVPELERRFVSYRVSGSPAVEKEHLVGVVSRAVGDRSKGGRNR